MVAGKYCKETSLPWQDSKLASLKVEFRSCFVRNPSFVEKLTAVSLKALSSAREMSGAEGMMFDYVSPRKE